MELESKVASGAARATRRRGWGNLELARGGFGSGSCSGFSDTEQVRDAAPGGRQTLTLHVRPSIPSSVHRHVPSRIWGPCRPATFHVDYKVLQTPRRPRVPAGPLWRAGFLQTRVSIDL